MDIAPYLRNLVGECAKFLLMLSLLHTWASDLISFQTPSARSGNSDNTSDHSVPATARFATNPLGALAHLGLARAYALSGDPAKARAAYQDFLTLWKDADLDIPILEEAKGEYARLK
jgi:hypothetical protein